MCYFVTLLLLHKKEFSYFEKNDFFLHFFAKKFAKPGEFDVPLHRNSKTTRLWLNSNYLQASPLSPERLTTSSSISETANSVPDDSTDLACNLKICRHNLEPSSRHYRAIIESDRIPVNRSTS